MNKTAFRQKTGNWIYYLTYFTYREVFDYVKKIEELHESKTLNDMIQRSLTDNVNKIATYIEKQEEHFFNALVLAVYDGDPQWREVELDYGDGEKYDLGILILNGKEKIFPVDGQHRVEGIKKLLEQHPDGSFDEDTIPVIMIGHKKDKNGMQRTRRLFSTLNRYAKPVSLSDIIALDEDDLVAISTRYLIEHCPLFQEERLNNHKQKAIPENDKTAFTNIISLYECNTELLKYFLKDKVVTFEGKVMRGARKIEEYRRIRPCDAEIDSFLKFVSDYWQSFFNEIDAIKEYLSIDIKNHPAERYRNKEGGNLLFRPIGQRPFVLSALSLYEKTNDLTAVMREMNKLDLNMADPVWEKIVWNPISKKMITSSNGSLITLMLKYFVRIDLSEKEKDKLINDYKSMKADPNLDEAYLWDLLNSNRIN